MSFWAIHGIFFIFFLFFFPRLTMLFTGIAFAWSGLLFWLGWIFAPRLTVAILATSVYWHTNMILCILAWLWALGGETFEKRSAKTYVIKSMVARHNNAMRDVN
ncbi:MAG: hypothetical protein NTV32_00030 [Gammaproteobacteria bacterium]|nr:hypothetical protein [Gammaproteobacteria bacterium]